MRSKKNLVIGFLLLLLGIGLSEHSLLLSIFAGVAGIVMMILYAAGNLKRNTSETSAVSSKTSKIQPPTKHSKPIRRASHFRWKRSSFISSLRTNTTES